MREAKPCAAPCDAPFRRHRPTPVPAPVDVIVVGAWLGASAFVGGLTGLVLGWVVWG